MKVKIRSGDTLWYYSRLFMIPLNLIIDSNTGIQCHKITCWSGDSVIPGFISQSYR